ncbi:MAG: amino acid adenylation domain-containing protein, partial [Candidatus Aminicenantes bacterium]|nr:amino acid adenylation domain-containing protein [Candidatus Aminicenantes bacterium]NIM82138.1 amino acid adenylation domain-containing protein [Candidatus Aminicenantes bacterium]NIN21535.1 amino acid adenylation domain-containing protein [Candidatus Aminicenantes bacterium]NIN45344.1 amino acid adenylation domain-containing protein [Candidatus Aminicenantes bacterium]NIN88165.1 amino acid adenylation domain-containing protein [Candidatus Aminicenantes bacterium]
GLPSLHLQYRDFALWQKHLVVSADMEKQKAYWLKQFESEPVELNLPVDYRRPGVQCFEGSRIEDEINETWSKALKGLASREEATLYMVLLSIYNILLFNLTGQCDIVVGTPAAGRRHTDLQQVFGMFVNTLALRNVPSPERTFTGFLKEVKARTLAAYENQDYPFEDLVEKVVKRRDTNRNPIFETFFVLQNLEAPEVEMAGLKLTPYPYENPVTKFDITITLLEKDGKICFAFEYCTKLFKKETILRFITYFKNIVYAVAENPNRLIGQIDVMAETEKQRLLYDFNDTIAGYPGEKTIHQLFQEQAERTPEKAAVVGSWQLAVGKKKRTKAAVQFTYGELNKSAYQLACVLIEKGVLPDDIVAIMVEPSIEMIIGILGILKAGGAYMPIDPDYPQERIDYMLKDSGAGILVSELSEVSKVSEGTRVATHLTHPTHPTHLCYIIYTSGTGGRPKGTMIDHRNVVRLLFNDRFGFEFTGSDVWTLFHSYCFDFSVWEMYGALLYGGKLVIIPRMLARDTRGYLELLKKENVTILNQTPSAFYNLMDEELTVQERALHLKYVIFGGEELKPNRLMAWVTQYPNTKLINMYGITETTVHVTCAEISDRDMKYNISNIGKPIPTLSTYVMDNRLKLLPIGVSGELLVGGEGVGRGYLNQSELTAEKFDHDLWDFQDYQDDKKNKKFLRGVQGGGFYKKSPPGRRRQRIYKTGDLARWLEDGNIEFLGRIDYQVKIRGYRVEPGEIENQLLIHEAVKEAVVLAREDESGDKYLCAYIVRASTSADEFKETLSLTEELKRHLSCALPGYMIPFFFVEIEKIPVTTGGKIDRKALSAAEIIIGAKSGYPAPRNPIERKLVEIWEEVLGVESPYSIGIDDNFFQLGGHSLKATVLVSRIQEHFHVNVRLTDVFIRPTIRAAAEMIAACETGFFESIQPVEKREYYPQSSAQKRLFFLDQFENIGTSYNMSTVLELNGEVNKKQLEHAFKRLIHRHETLRTSFELIDNEPVQLVHDNVEFEIEYISLEQGVAPPTKKGAKSLESPYTLRPTRDTMRYAAIQNFIRPFDLSQAPLLGVGLVDISETKHLLLFDMHHIVGDGTSAEVLTDEIFSIYAGEKLPPLKIQYKDFSNWQNQLIESQKIKSQEEYWINLYADAPNIPVLNLPGDCPRPAVFSFEGDNYVFKLYKKEASAFKKLGDAHNTSLFMSLLAAFNVLLFKYTGQSDIIVGSGIAGRRHADLYQIIGLFVNMLALRNFPTPDKTYVQFLEEVRETSLQAYENQDVQFEELVDRLELRRDASRNPLFDVLVVNQNFDQSCKEYENVGFTLSPYDYFEIKASKFDLTLFAYEAGDEIRFKLEYYTAVFKPETIEQLVNHFLNLIGQVTREPGIRISDIDILSAEEKRQQLFDFNDTAVRYPGDKTIHQLFAEQVERRPESIALVGSWQLAVGGAAPPPNKEERIEETRQWVQLTYRELDNKSNQLANYLIKEKGICLEERVGILMGQSINRFIAVLGVLKAGGAYVPLDPVLPEERIKNIMNDAEIGIILSEEKEIQRLNRLQWECKTFHTYLCMDVSHGVHWVEEGEKNQLMDERLWRYVGETAVDEITAGGWINSFTGEPFSREEMDEYGDNILEKLMPLLHPRMRVLEIGCGSGISMLRIAPKVGFYLGIDLSEVIIWKTKQRVEAEEHQNIALSALPAHDIHYLKEKDFDLVIINSVIQCFHGHNYLRKVILKAIDFMGERGYLFIGDVMNQDLKDSLLHDLQAFKQAHRDKNYKTKTDFSQELFISPAYFEDLVADIPQIKSVEFSDKIYTIENELTRYRYDVLIKVDKQRDVPVNGRQGDKHKYQHDMTVLAPYGPGRPGSKVSSQNLAYVIYTSGTTGKPKGVVVRHKSLVNLCFWHNRYYQVREFEHTAQYAGFGFDASGWEVFPYIVRGAVIYLIADDMRLDIQQLNDYYEKNQVTISYLPTQICEQFMRLNNQYLRKLLTGGDKLRIFVNNNYDLYNNYGPTENTVVTTVFQVERFEDNIPIGSPIDNHRVYILNPDNLQLQPLMVVGELCIAGDGLARGYLNRPELTAEKFILAHSSWLIADRRKKKVGSSGKFPMSYELSAMSCLYRTGDLARRLRDGSIKFMGRIDSQVKLRGYRIELGGIETLLLAHEGIKEACVIDREEANGHKYLCAYIVPVLGAEVPDNQELRIYLSAELPDYMVPEYFVRMERIPLTPGGKIDKKALLAPWLGEYRDASVDFAAPENETQERLAKVWSDVLFGKDPMYTTSMGQPLIGIDDNFFELGGHSLKAIILVSHLQKELGVTVPLAEIFTRPTIKELAVYIEEASKSVYDHIKSAPEGQVFYPQSSAQKRLYVLAGMDPQGISYNIFSAWLLEGNIQRGKLENIFKKLIQRHESLRTSFHLVNEEPVQKIHDDVEFEIEYYNLATEEDFVSAFDLSKAPLMRVGLIGLDQDKHILMVDMHHIISDAASMEILVKDFMVLYNGEELPPVRIQYKDFAWWQQGESQKEIIKKHEIYWLNRFSHEIPVLNLPYDFPRLPVLSFEGCTLEFELDEIQTTALNHLALREQATLFMVLLAAYTVLLSKLSGQEEITVGSPVIGRLHVDLQKVIGMFVNTLALRNTVNYEKTFTVFLKNIKQNALEAFENQGFPFEELVEKVVVERDTSRNPLFDVMFALQNVETSEIRIPGLKITPYPYENSTALFDITLNAYETGGNKNLVFNLTYSTRLFKETTVRRFVSYFMQILAQIKENPEINVSAIEIIDEKEKQQILLEFNNTAVDYPQDKTIVQLFKEQAEKTPEKVAVVGSWQLAVGKKKRTKAVVQFTYGELNKRSDQLACVLIEKGVKPDTIVAIMVEPSIEMIIAILGILKAGGAYLPIDPEYPQERIDYMLKDSGARVMVSELSELSKVSEGTEVVTHLTHPTHLCYLIYTSGTTGMPKGVMVEHRGVVNYTCWRLKTYRFTPSDVTLQLLSYSFDGFGSNFYSALLSGGTLLMAPESRNLDGGFIKEVFQNHHITNISLVPSLYEFTLENTGKESLQSLRFVVLAGEKASTTLLEKSHQIVPQAQLINEYGPTETTVTAAAHIDMDIDAPHHIGKPIANVRIHILDTFFNILPIGVVGELFIAGEGLARGYLNNPELTAEKFDHDLWDFQDYQDEKKNIKFLRGVQGGGFYKKSPPGRRRLYKTGDLARWLPDGDIEFLGRIDRQVKIRGYRIEPGEIENRLRAHEKIKEAAVIVHTSEDKAEEKYLCAYIVPADATALEEMPGTVKLREYLSHLLPDYMIPSYFVSVEHLPLTPSGKLNRRALPGSQRELEKYVAPGNLLEKKLIEIWSRVLGRDASHVPPGIGIDDNFFRLGGHSLMAMRMVSAIQKELDVHIPLVEIFHNPTIRQLAGYVNTASKVPFAPIRVTETKEYYPLSSAQKRLYVLYRISPDNLAYNISHVMLLEGELDLERFLGVFRDLPGLHESFRTSFHMQGEEPVQRVHDDVEFKIEYYDLAAKNAKEREEDYLMQSFICPFDLSKAPLLRVGLIKTGERQHLLMLDMHHIICDGISIEIFIKEFVALYADSDRKEPQPEPGIQYRDYAQWQTSDAWRAAIKQQETWWSQQFTGEVPLLDLPCDYPRPPVQSFEGRTIDFDISLGEVNQLKALALDRDVTLYMLLLALYNVLLSKLSGQDDMIIGTPVAGRRHDSVQHIIGMFVNTLALRNTIENEKTFRDFINQLKHNILNAFENQDYPFEELVERVPVERDIGRNPLFDVMFALQNEEAFEIQFPGLKIIPYPNENQASLFDMLLIANETKESLSFSLTYSTALFKETTARKFTGYFKRIVSRILKDPGIKIGDIEIISKEEKQRILVEFNNTAADYPQDKTIYQLFQEQVKRTPDHIAVLGNNEKFQIPNSKLQTNSKSQITNYKPQTHPGELDKSQDCISITYRELNEKAIQIAHLLREKGVQPDAIVAIMVEPSIEMIIGILGILKAGSAYMPIDPEYPQERIDYMLKDSGAGILVSELSEVSKVSEGTEVVTHLTHPTHLCYLLYTSGTTGRPKGVMVEHGNVVNILWSLHQAYPFGESDAYLFKTSYLFDVSVTELFGWFLGGGRLVLMEPGDHKNPARIVEAIQRHLITHINFVPSMFNAFVEYLHHYDICRLPGLKYIFLAGEALLPTLVEKFRHLFPEIPLENLYGPTEGTIYASRFSLSGWNGEGAISIGKPISNIQLYILDRNLYLQPVGVTGELCIGGAGVTRGYLNNPELTAEKFDHDLWDFQDYRDEKKNKKFLRGV